jgi:hypothetical protein
MVTMAAGMFAIGKMNIILGWITMVTGILSGAIIGMYAFAGPFPAPKGHKDYADLPRRMVRLGHIALVMLPLINVVYGQFIDSIPVSDSLKLFGSWCMIVCMFGVPLFLFMASVYLPFKYLEVIPVTAGAIGLAIISYGHLLML